jgi:predicted RNA-binding Zn ribbon-like protein
VRAELRAGRVVLAGEDALAEVTAIALASMLDGAWPRLKVCRKCEWAFYDRSKNRSGSWCSMQLCGNRLKTRAYRTRRRSPRT